MFLTLLLFYFVAICILFLKNPGGSISSHLKNHSVRVRICQHARVLENITSYKTQLEICNLHYPFYYFNMNSLIQILLALGIAAENNFLPDDRLNAHTYTALPLMNQAVRMKSQIEQPRLSAAFKVAFRRRLNFLDHIKSR